MPLAALIGGALGAAGSVASSLLSNSSAKNRQQEMLEYNSPVNQRKRLMAAGINPAIAMQNGAMDSGNASSAAPPMPQFDVNSLAQGLRDSVALRLQKQETDADVGLKEANTEAQRIRNKTLLQENIANLEKLRAEAQEKNRNTDYLDQLISKTKKDLQWYDLRVGAEVHKTESEAFYIEAQTAYQNIVNQFEGKYRVALINSLQAHSAEMYAAARHHDASAVREYAEAAVAGAQKAGLDIDNDQKDALVDVIVNKAYADAEKSYYDAGNAGKEYTGGTIGKLVGSGTERQRHSNEPSIYSDWQTVPRNHRKK